VVGCVQEMKREKTEEMGEKVKWPIMIMMMEMKIK
jgi:hypothetical protein